MSAVLEAWEPSARYLEALEPALVKQVDLLATAPSGIARLRELILTLAVQGKLVPQDSSDEPADQLLSRLFDEQCVLPSRRRKKAETFEPAKLKEPYALPRSWKAARLAAVAVKLTDGSHNPPRDAGSGVPMLSSQNVIENGTIDFASPTRYVGAEDFERENARTDASPGDVLLTIVASLGRSAVVADDAPAFVLQRSVAVIRTGLASRYLAMFLRSPVARAYYDEHGKGTAQKGIYLGKLGELFVPVPPLTEQARIVARVEELRSLCISLRQRLTACQTTQSRLADALVETATA